MASEHAYGGEEVEEEKKEEAAEKRWRGSAMRCRTNVRSILFNGTMVIVYVALIVVTLVALGFFAAKNADVQKNLNSTYASSDSPCALYASSDPPMSGPEINCRFVIAGEVIVLAAGISLLVLSVVKAAIGVNL